MILRSAWPSSEQRVDMWLCLAHFFFATDFFQDKKGATSRSFFSHRSHSPPKMDDWIVRANLHAAKAQFTRNLPLISASHYRALQLLLSVEAHDAHLTPQQRMNAQTLLNHYRQQYDNNCLCSSSSRTADEQHQHNQNGDLDRNPRGIVDYVHRQVRKTLDRKRNSKGFVSMLASEANMSSCQISLDDLASLVIHRIQDTVRLDVYSFIMLT